MSWLKKLSSMLPLRTQQKLKRLHYTRQVGLGRFTTSEPEYAHLNEWVASGDWVIDVGANVGHYTARLSRLVGSSGRVLAFEPVRDTFELLASIVSVTNAHNVSLFNAAASSEFGIAGMSIPLFTTGLTNYYMAHLTGNDSKFNVLTVPIDALMPPTRVTLIKIDVEGHELQALHGMRALLLRDAPRLIVEGRSKDVESFLIGLGYRFMELKGSPNRVFEKP